MVERLGSDVNNRLPSFRDLRAKSSSIKLDLDAGIVLCC